MKQFVQRAGGRIGLWGGLLGGCVGSVCGGVAGAGTRAGGLQAERADRRAGLFALFPCCTGGGYIRCRYARRPFPAGKMGLPDL